MCNFSSTDDTSLIRHAFLSPDPDDDKRKIQQLEICD
jgi:hypothetical protein